MSLTGELLLALAAKSTLALVLAALLAKALDGLRRRLSMWFGPPRWLVCCSCRFWAEILAGLACACFPWLVTVVSGEPSVVVVDVVASQPGFLFSPVSLAWGIWALGCGIVLLHMAVGLAKVGPCRSRSVRCWLGDPNVFASPECWSLAVFGFGSSRIILALTTHAAGQPRACGWC